MSSYPRTPKSIPTTSSPLPNDKANQFQSHALIYPNQTQAKNVDVIGKLLASNKEKDSIIQKLSDQIKDYNLNNISNQSNKKLDKHFEQMNNSSTRNLEKMIQQLKSENEKLRTKLKKIQNQKTAIHKPLTIEISSPKMQLESNWNQKQIISLQKQLSDQEKQMKKLILTKSSYPSQIKSFKQKMQEEMSRFLNKMEGKDQEIKQLQKQLEQTRKQVDQYKLRQTKSNKFIKSMIDGWAKLEIKQEKGKLSLDNLIKISREIQSSKIADVNREQILKLQSEIVESANKRIYQLISIHQKCQQTITTLNSKNFNLNSQLSDARTKIASLNTSFENQKKKKEEIEKDKLKALKEVETLKQNKQKLQRANNELTDQVRNLQSIKRENQKQINKLNNNIIDLNSSIVQLTNSKNTLLSQKAALQKRIKQLQKNIQDLKKKILNLQGQVSKKDVIIQSLNQTIRQLNGKIKDLTTQLEAANKTISLNTSKIQHQQKQNKKLVDQNTKLKNQKKKLSDELRNLRDEHHQLQTDFNLKNNKLEEANDQIKSLNTITSKINREFIGETSRFFLGEPKILQSIIPQRSQQLDSQMESIMKKWRSSYNRVKFFNGSTILTTEDTDWIIEKLEDYARETLTFSKFIYKYDELNIVNFHKYLDNIPDLIFFVKLSNGTKIGGLTRYPLVDGNTYRPGKGFIFNLNHKKVFNMKGQCRLPVVGYDPYYFLMGNAQIRLRSQEKRVFSNFGTNNATFESGAFKRTQFLGVNEMGDNELDIQGYEFYQVIFKQ